MRLPILQVRQEPSAADLVRLFHKCDVHWVEQLSDPVALEVGTAYANAEFSEVWTANTLREAALHGGMTAAEAAAEVNAHYAAMGTRCAYWVMNPSAGAAQTGPLVEHLLRVGFRRQVEDIFYLGKGKSFAQANCTEEKGKSFAEANPTGEVQIIPARASFRHARLLAEESAKEKWGGLDQLVEARLRRLDNPHFDALLGLMEGRAIAGLGVLVVGEMGMIEEVYVAREFRRRGIGRMMMARALEICARSLFKHVFVCTEPHNEAAQGLYRSAGFEKIGEFISYRAPGL